MNKSCSRFFFVISLIELLLGVVGSIFMIWEFICFFSVSETGFDGMHTVTNEEQLIRLLILIAGIIPNIMLLDCGVESLRLKKRTLITHHFLSLYYLFALIFTWFVDYLAPDYSITHEIYISFILLGIVILIARQFLAKALSAF